MGEVDIPGFDDTVQTLCCTNTRHNCWVQVTHSSVRLVDCGTSSLVHEWIPTMAKESGGGGGGGSTTMITVAATNPSQVLVALGGGNLVLLDILEKKLVVSSQTTLDHEVACLDISPLGKQGEQGGEDDNKASFGAVGMWIDMSVRVLSLPSLEEYTRHVLSASSGGEGVSDVISRSVMFHVFGQHSHLLVGLGDGRLLNFQFDPSGDSKDSLKNLKRVTLGTQPIGLKRFRARDKEYVFAASDRPTVVYCNNGKVLYSNVNRGEVTTVSSFNTFVFLVFFPLFFSLFFCSQLFFSPSVCTYFILRIIIFISFYSFSGLTFLTRLHSHLTTPCPSVRSMKFKSFTFVMNQLVSHPSVLHTTSPRVRS